MRGVMIRRPLVERVCAVAGGVDRGQAAPPAVDDVPAGGEREGGHRDTESGGRGEQVK
jgi:hypothetical protein